MRSGTTRKIALVNVFFPPRAIGGATRVIADQFDTLVQRYADRFDCVVFTSDDDCRHQPYRVHVYPYKGARVYSAGVSFGNHMDWRPEDKKMGELFALFLENEQPELIHFHCIQRLTASIVEVAQEKGIPYIITVHDAWWISDFQFLVDPQDRVYSEGHPDPYVMPPTPDGISLDQSLQRRYYLKALLNKARCVLAVSESFAAIYRKNGIRNVAVNKNGVSPLAWQPKNTVYTEKVVCAHIGGMAEHKGYFSFKASIEQARPRHIEVLVVDHSKAEDYVSREQWNGVNVTFIGRVRQQRITALYARIDVLFAPSKWPESYGLAVREALASRCWVVASNLGAIGEDIVPGKNGFIVDVSSNSELCKIIETIDKTPSKFKQYSADYRVRNASEQVDELVKFYIDVIGNE
ncbi:MAG: glycosyltransferase family 4 protein [Gammaproteobacteria bacterium]